MSVSITPQAMALTLMPEGANSLAKALVNELTPPPLLAEYATSHEAPPSLPPHIEEIFIIEPW